MINRCGPTPLLGSPQTYCDGEIKDKCQLGHTCAAHKRVQSGDLGQVEATPMALIGRCRVSKAVTQHNLACLEAGRNDGLNMLRTISQHEQQFGLSGKWHSSLLFHSLLFQLGM